MNRLRIGLVLAGIALGVALTAGIGAVVLLHHAHSAHPARSTGAGKAQDGTLSAEGRELADLMQKGLDVTYHARYQSAIADPRAQGTQMTMDVWRKGQLTRQEVAVQAQNAKSRSDTFQLPPQAFQCTQVGDSPWTCKPPSEAKAPDPPEIKIREELARGSIQARDDAIAGVPVRCFTFPAGGDLTETCLMQDGVVARMVTTSSRFDLVAFTATVPDDVFTLPAAAQ